MTYKECCNAILANSWLHTLAYAVNYAKAGRDMEGKEAQVQALYILRNMAYWRGAEAKQVRAALKAFTGVK